MPQGWDDTGQGRHRCARRLQKKQLEPRLEEAKTGQRVVFFVDAAHFVLAPYLGMLWCFARQFIRAPAGRQRFNVLGALNAVTHELILVTNDAYINADSVCDLLRRIAAQGLTIPITLILDNARYQKCHIVLELAKSLGIELLYLPTYSPNHAQPQSHRTPMEIRQEGLF